MIIMPFFFLMIIFDYVFTWKTLHQFSYLKTADFTKFAAILTSTLFREGSEWLI